MGRVSSWAPRIAFAAVLFVIARSLQQQGHGWGDDFALYINQARGLLDGTAAQVVADNRYAMDNSAFASFTPIAYPWGTSLLLAPVLLIAGLDYAALKLIPTIAFVVAALAFWRLAERRVGWIAAAALALMVALNPWYLWTTDAVLSDLPFMAAVFGTLVVMDRAVERGSLLIGRHPDALWIGAFIALAFHLRREGLGLLVALAVAQLAIWRARTPMTMPSRGATGPRALAARVATPWLAFVIGAVGGHLVFPAPIRGNVDIAGEPGLGQVRPNLEWYRQPFAELVGLKRIGDEPVMAFGSGVLGDALVWVLLLGAVLGAGAAVIALIRRRRTLDAHLAGALLGIGMIVMMTPYHYQRYLFTLVPLVVLLAARGLTSLAPDERVGNHLIRRTLAAQLVVVVLLAPSLVDMVRQTDNSLRYHRTYSYVLRGPEDIPTQQLFDAVRHYTDGRDVIVFFQPRTMNLYTHRLSIVGNSETMMVRRGDWYAMERDSDYLQTPLSDTRAAELGFVRVWENERYVLWQIPPPPAPAAIGVTSDPAG